MEFYEKEVRSALTRRFQYKNVMEVPKIEKITVNVGLGEALQNVKALDSASADIKAITGQKPVITKSKKSIASFKLREGQSIGCMVTLRRERMYEFLHKLVYIVLPRVRDFKGVSPKSFDGRATIRWGLKNRSYSEIDYDKIIK
jgi:large subunit ribosomal protein L5